MRYKDYDKIDIHLYQCKHSNISFMMIGYTPIVDRISLVKMIYLLTTLLHFLICVPQRHSC